MNSFGRRLRLSLFGESHGEGVGVVVDGVPPGLPLDVARIRADLDLRRPGRGKLVSQRREEDEPRFLAGVLDGRATGAPLCIWIENRDAQPTSYSAARDLPRPGHSDWTNHVWSRGFADLRGGGHSSGRLTAPLVAAGTVAQAILDQHAIRCAASLQQVGDVVAPLYAEDVDGMLKRVPLSPVFASHGPSEVAFEARIEEARRGRDSIGGAVEFAADGLPPGLGDPVFDAVESQLAHLLFAVPAVKGVEFGAGFRSIAMKGSQHNDPFVVKDGKIGVATNHAGGIVGGRTTGATLRGRVAVKPASSIFLPQQTVDLATGEPATLELTGRHDPCIAVRAVHVIQACLRLVLADFALQARQEGHLPVPEVARLPSGGSAP